MSTIIQLRRGSSSEASNLLGFEGELFLDLDNQQLRYHDGSQIGGYIIGRNANTIAEYNITDAYTQTQTNDLLDQKANLGTTLSDYGITDAYTQTQTNDLLDSVKVGIESDGNVTSITALDTEIEITGDFVPTSHIFNLGSDTTSFGSLFLGGSEISVNGGTLFINGSDIVTSNGLSTVISDELTTFSETNKTLSDLSITDAYTQGQIDTIINDAVSDKFDTPTTLTIAGFGITDAYTKTEVYNKFEVYTRTEIDTLISGTFKTTPTAQIGSSGDTEGEIAQDANYFYICTADYDGVTNIWKRISWDTGSW